MSDCPLAAYRDALRRFADLALDPTTLRPPFDSEAEHLLIDAAGALRPERRALEDCGPPLTERLSLHLDSVSSVVRAVRERAGWFVVPVGVEPDGDEREAREVFDGDDPDVPPTMELLPARVRHVCRDVFHPSEATLTVRHQATPDEARAVAEALRAVDAALLEARAAAAVGPPLSEENLSERDRLILDEARNGTKYTIIARRAHLSESGVRRVLKGFRDSGIGTGVPRKRGRQPR